MDALAKSPNQPSRQTGENAAAFAYFNMEGRDFHLACLTSTEQIRAIKPQWQKLEQNNAERFAYFQSFDWCYLWCISKFETDRIVREAELCVYVLRCGDDLVMIWPMMKVKTRIGAKILAFVTDPLDQYANVLVDRAVVSAKIGCKVWQLVRQHTDVDAVTVNHYPAGSFLEAMLCGVGFVERSRSEASILDLTKFDNWQDHHASLLRNQRKQRNRRRTKLAKQGKVTYEVDLGGSKKYVKNVGIALDMKRIWLEKTGRKPGILADETTKAFLESLTGSSDCAASCPQGAMTHALCVDGKPVAIEIGMAMGGHYYSYLGAFDWEWRDFSPGKIQIESAQEWAKSVGAQWFDLLGDPSQYKGQWTNRTHRLQSRSMPITALGLIYCAIWKTHLRPKLKNAYNSMGADRRALLTSMAAFAGRFSATGNNDRVAAQNRIDNSP